MKIGLNYSHCFWSCASINTLMYSRKALLKRIELLTITVGADSGAHDGFRETEECTGQ
jgi:hypothetical protein